MRTWREMRRRSFRERWREGGHPRKTSCVETRIGISAKVCDNCEFGKREVGKSLEGRALEESYGTCVYGGRGGKSCITIMCQYLCRTSNCCPGVLEAF